MKGDKELVGTLRGFDDFFSKKFYNNDHQFKLK